MFLFGYLWRNVRTFKIKSPNPHHFDMACCLLKTANSARHSCLLVAGFDSKVSETVSIPRTEMNTRKPYFNHLNGEDNYALAA